MTCGTVSVSENPALPGGRTIDFPDMGHGPFDLDRWTEGDCFDRTAAAFLANPARVDTLCIARMRPPPFK